MSFGGIFNGLATSPSLKNKWTVMKYNFTHIVKTYQDTLLKRGSEGRELGIKPGKKVRWLELVAQRKAHAVSQFKNLSYNRRFIFRQPQHLRFDG